MIRKDGFGDIITSFNDVHPLKTEPSILYTCDGIRITFKFVQLKNAHLPIDINDGIIVVVPHDDDDDDVLYTCDEN